MTPPPQRRRAGARRPGARRPGARKPEAEWQDKVIQVATSYRWDYYHPADVDPRAVGRYYRPGWVDLTLAKPDVGRVLFVELKADGNYPSPDQRRWLAQLDAAGLEVGVWWPKDLPTVLQVLGPAGLRLELPPRYRHTPPM